MSSQEMSNLLEENNKLKTKISVLEKIFKNHLPLVRGSSGGVGGGALSRGAEQESTPVTDDEETTAANLMYFTNIGAVGSNGQLIEITDLEIKGGTATAGNTCVCAYIRSAAGFWQLVAVTPEFTPAISTTEKRKCYSSLFNGGQTVVLAILTDTGGGNTKRSLGVASSAHSLPVTYTYPPPLAIEGTEANLTSEPYIKAYFRVWI